MIHRDHGPPSGGPPFPPHLSGSIVYPDPPTIIPSAGAAVAQWGVCYSHSAAALARHSYAGTEAPWRIVAGVPVTASVADAVRELLEDAAAYFTGRALHRPVTQTVSVHVLPHHTETEARWVVVENRIEPRSPDVEAP